MAFAFVPRLMVKSVERRTIPRAVHLIAGAGGTASADDLCFHAFWGCHLFELN